MVYARSTSPFGTEPDVYIGSLNFDVIKDRLRELLDELAAIGDALEDPLVQTALQIPLPFLDDPNNNTIDNAKSISGETTIASGSHKRGK